MNTEQKESMFCTHDDISVYQLMYIKLVEKLCNCARNGSTCALLLKKQGERGKGVVTGSMWAEPGRS